MGETVAALPLVRRLQEADNSLQIFITTMTPTGSERVESLFGDSVFHSYIPYDLPGSLQRFLRRVKPDVLILMETELWPNTIHYTHSTGSKILLANARLSAKSAAGYQKFSGLSQGMLQSIDVIAAQAQADADRFLTLGMDKNKLEVTGSLKFLVDTTNADIELPQIVEELRKTERLVLVAASTREGEEAKVLVAFKECLKLLPQLILLLIPRHPERFDKVAKLCGKSELEVLRRSSNSALHSTTQVVLGDSMGEMLAYYQCADIAFVGGSLVDTGCQNVLEPAALGLAVLVGPSQFNFASICAQLEAAGSLRTVANESELADAVNKLAADKNQRAEMGKQGKELVAANQQALPALMQIVSRLLK